jgi:DNA polymerase-3 subunit beta
MDVKGIIIPTKVLNLLRKLLPGDGNLSICLTEKNVFFKYGNHRLSSNLIDGQFPNYHRVIPEQQEQHIVVQRELLQNAMKRVSLLVEQKSRRIFLKISENNLAVSSEESDIGTAKEELPCEYSGPEDTIALNYLYVVEPLKEMTEEKVNVEFTETNKAITIKPIPEKDYLHVVMPMQIK